MSKENVYQKMLKKISAWIVVLLILNLPLVAALEISNVRAENVTETSAIIRWNTDEPANSFVYYGKENEALREMGDGNLVVNHQFSLTELVPATNYNYKVESGDVAEEELHTFTTLASDTTPPESLEVELPEKIKGDTVDITGTTEADATVNLYVNNILTASTVASYSDTGFSSPADGAEVQPSGSDSLPYSVSKYLQEGSQTRKTSRVNEIANGIKGNNDREIVENIMKWVSDNLREEPVSDEIKGSLTVQQTLDRGTVSGCTEFALIFITLARAKNIPAIYVETIEENFLNTIKSQEDRPGTFLGHAFADVYLNGEWVSVDPMGGYFNSRDNNCKSAFEGNNGCYLRKDGGRNVPYVIFRKGIDFWDFGFRDKKEFTDYVYTHKNSISSGRESTTLAGRAAGIGDKSKGFFRFSDVRLISSGLNTIKVEAVDSSGNKATFTGTVESDSTPPQITLQELPSLIDKSKVKLKGTVSEESSIEIFVNDRSMKKLEGTIIDEEVTLNEGENIIMVTATDAAGWEVSEELVIESDTKPPRVTFELTKGTEYYEGRAETDIIGETEPGADVYLYVFNRHTQQYTADFSHALEKTTADQDGKFEFKEVSFPPSGLPTLEELKPREVPTGLEEILISPLDALAQEQRKIYQVYVIAEDKTGKSAAAPPKTVNVNTCYSGNFAFNIYPTPEFPPMPFKLNPTEMEEGRESIATLYTVEYKGAAVEQVNQITNEIEQGYRISNIRVEKACTREMAEKDDYSLGCRLIGGFQTQPNADKSMVYLTANLLPAKEFLDKEDNPWDDFVKKRQLKFPVKILVTYTEKEYGSSSDSTSSSMYSSTYSSGGTPVESFGQSKTQVYCTDLGYFVDVPIESSKMIPDFLAEDTVSALNWTIEKIEMVQKPLRTAAIIAGVGCVGSFLTKMVIKFYRMFYERFEPYSSKFKSGDETSEACPFDQTTLYLESTIKHWQELETNYQGTKAAANLFPKLDDKNNLNKRCPSTAKAWEMETFFDKVHKLTCDRFLCRSVPARWTESAGEQEVRDVISEQKQCAVSTTGIGLNVIENCQERLEENPEAKEYLSDIGKSSFECYEYQNVLYYQYDDDNRDTTLTSRGIYTLTPVGKVLRLGQLPKEKLLVYQPLGASNYIVATDKTCEQMCARTRGYAPATNGYQGYMTNEERLIASEQIRVAEVKNDSGSIFYVNPDGKVLDQNRQEVRKEDAGLTEQKINEAKIKIGTFTQAEKESIEVKDISLKPPRITDRGCFREVNENGKIVLESKDGKKLFDNQYDAEYTRDCFINENDKEMYHCVCEELSPEEYEEKSDSTHYLRTALPKDKASGVEEEWVYHQDTVYQSTHGRKGTYYPEWRYYSGRDWSGAFGLNYAFDNFLGDETQKHVARIEPVTDLWATFQAVCLRHMYARLEILKSTLIGLRNCLIQAKYTGFQDAGMCKSLFTQYFCGMIYKAITYFGSQCSPLSFGDKSAGDEEESMAAHFVRSGLNAVPAAMDESISQIKSDYGDANLNQFFAMGTQGFAESLCLFALGYDFPMGMDFIEDMAVSASTSVDVNFILANRKLTTYDPARGTAVFDYELGGYMIPGCGVRGYRIELKCVGPEDMGRPGVDCTQQSCDCLSVVGSNPEFAGERVRPLEEGGSNFGGVTKNQYMEFPIPSPQKVSSSYRYDHVLVHVYLDQGEDPNTCFEKGYQEGTGGVFYFPITQIHDPGLLTCNVHPLSGKYVCPNVQNLFTGGKTYLEHPYVECFDRRNNEFVDCTQTPNLFLLNEPIIIRPYLFLGSEPACLKISDLNTGTIDLTQPMPEEITGQWAPRLELGTVTTNMIGGGRAGNIVRSYNSDRCGDQLDVFATPDFGETTTGKTLTFNYYLQPGGKYKLQVDQKVNVEDPYKVVNGYLQLNGREELAPEEIDYAVFMVDGFKFRRMFGTPVPQDGQTGKCVYQVSPPGGNVATANMGNLRVKLELLQPKEGTSCYGATTKMPQTTLGKTLHSVDIRVQNKLVETAIASFIHDDFIKGNYGAVIQKADAVVRRNEANLDDAIAMYYWIASLVMSSAPSAEVRSLLSTFFERNYDYLTTDNDEFGKITAYLCEIKNKVETGSQVIDDKGKCNVAVSSGNT